MKVVVISFLVSLLLAVSGCAVNLTHNIQYPAADDLFVTSGDDPASESLKPYIPKGKIIQFNQEAYFPIPILGIFLKVGNAEPQYVFDSYVTPNVRKMGGDALTDAYVGYEPESAWYMGIIGMRTGQSTLIMGQTVKRGGTTQTSALESNTEGMNSDLEISNNESFKNDEQPLSNNQGQPELDFSGSNMIGGIDAAIEAVTPIGDFSDWAGNGIGMSMKAYYPVIKDTNGGLDVSFKIGYTYFMEYEYEINYGFGSYEMTYSWSQLSLLAGCRYKQIIPDLAGSAYGSFELGMCRLAVSVSDSEFDFEDDELDIAYTLGAGYIYDKYDFSIFYNSVITEEYSENFNHVGLRIGYVIQ